jgi:hypothetical protein
MSSPLWGAAFRIEEWVVFARTGVEASRQSGISGSQASVVEKTGDQATRGLTRLSQRRRGKKAEVGVVEPTWGGV